SLLTPTPEPPEPPPAAQIFLAAPSPGMVRRAICSRGSRLVPARSGGIAHAVLRAGTHTDWLYCTWPILHRVFLYYVCAANSLGSDGIIGRRQSLGGTFLVAGRNS